MASLATCPLCAKQLAIPDGTTSDDRAECPECDATFLLSNAFQTSLPTARILPAIESSSAHEALPVEPVSQEPTPLEPTSPEAAIENSLDSYDDSQPPKPVTLDFDPVRLEEPSSEPTGEEASVASLASWESRLKNAIERDAAELSDQPTAEQTLAPDTPAVDASTADQPQTSNPEFDFHIDPPVAEQKLETETQPVQQFDHVELPEPESAESISKEPEVAPIKNQPAPAELAEAELVEAEQLTMGLNTLHPRRSRRFSPLKIGAVLVSSGVVGIFLGLYSLLWIQGPRGDLVNLAQILPAAMLPPTITASETESPDDTPPPADTQELLVADEPTNQPPPLETEPLESEPLESLVNESDVNVPDNDRPIHDQPIHDNAVRPATAEQPASPPFNALPIHFSEIISAALAAQPEFVGGNLSTNEAVSQKGKAYMTICQLAQEFQAIQLPDPDAQAESQIASAKELFDSIASDSSALSDLAAIASRWWGYDSRPNQGIFFAGQIQNLQPLGAQTVCYVALDQPHSETVIPILLDQALDQASVPREGDRIVVVGNIVAEPSNNLQGFTVDLPQVVVATYSHTLQP